MNGSLTRLFSNDIMLVDQSDSIEEFQFVKKGNTIHLSLKVNKKIFKGIIVQQDLSSFNEIQPFSIKQLKLLLQRQNTSIMRFQSPNHLSICLGRLKPSNRGIYLNVKLNKQQGKQLYQPSLNTLSVINKLSDVEHKMQQQIDKISLAQKNIEALMDLRFGVENMAKKIEQITGKQQNIRQISQFTYEYCLDNVLQVKKTMYSLAKKVETLKQTLEQMKEERRDRYQERRDRQQLTEGSKIEMSQISNMEIYRLGNDASQLQITKKE